MLWSAAVAFGLAVVPLVITPGASFTLATQRSLSGERFAVSWVIAGTATGIYLHALLAAAGLSAIVLRSAEAFAVVRVIGAVYLIGLGVWTIWQSRQRRGAVPRRRGRRRRRLARTAHRPYPQALLANVLNPKAASVYLTLAPQFVTAREFSVPSMLVLATAHVLAMAVWLGLWGGVLRSGRQVTHSVRFRAWIDRIGGTILIALGVRTAVA